MITEFYSKNFGFLHADQLTEPSLSRLKNQCLKTSKITASDNRSNEEHCRQLESLFAQYIVNHLDLKFDSLPNETHTPSIKQLFSSPSARLPLLAELTMQLQQLLYVSRTSHSNAEFASTMGLSQAIKNKLVHRANLPPFAANHRPITHFDEAQKLLTRNQFDAACCASFIDVALSDEGSNVFHNSILQEGINLAYISSLIASDKQFDPMRLFLTAIMRSVSLLLVHNQLQQSEGLPSKKQLFSDIQSLLPRLDYWLAKDLGLPDDILHTLKSRFMNVGSTPIAVKILYMSERCQLSILLFNRSLISSREVQKVLQCQGVTHLHLLQKLQLTQH